MVMNSKALSEIRRRFTVDNTNLTCIRGCYVSEKREIISMFKLPPVSLPHEEGDRYARLVYDYRDLAYNLYNAVPPKSGRNTFFAGLSGLKQKRCRTGR